MILVEVCSCLIVWNRDFRQIPDCNNEDQKLPRNWEWRISYPAEARLPLLYNCYIIIEIGEEEVGLKIFVQSHRFDIHYSRLFWVKAIELLNELKLKILQNISLWRINMLFANEYDDYSSSLFVFFWSVFIFYNRGVLPGMGNRKM